MQLIRHKTCSDFNLSSIRQAKAKSQRLWDVPTKLVPGPTIEADHESACVLLPSDAYNVNCDCLSLSSRDAWVMIAMSSLDGIDGSNALSLSPGERVRG